MVQTTSVIGVYLNLFTGLLFSRLSLLQSVFHVLLNELSKNQRSVSSLAFKCLYNLASISIQALILPILSHKPYVLYQTSHWPHEAPGLFPPLFPLLRMPFPLVHLANSQSTSKIQFKVLMKHFLYAPRLSWI